MRPREVIREVLGEIKRWERFLQHTTPQWRALPPEQAAQWVPASDELEQVRIGYALTRWLIDLRRAQQALATCAACWPHARPWAEKAARRLEDRRAVDRVFAGLPRASRHRHVRGMLHHFMSGERPQAGPWEDLDGFMAALYRHRELLALRDVARSMDMVVLPMGLLNPRPLEDHYKTLSEHERAFVGYFLGNFLRSELLLTWGARGRQALRPYKTLLDMANTPEKDMRESESIASALRGLDIDPRDREWIRAALVRVEENIREMGYDDFHASVTSDGGTLAWVEGGAGEVDFDDFGASVTSSGAQGGPGSVGGAPIPINLIPSARKGACHPTLLALSKGSGRSARGFAKVLEGSLVHLIDCFAATRTVVFITDTWDPRLLKSSQAHLQAHRRRGIHFLFFLVSGDRLSPIHLPL